jgi:hypothetical protein
MHPARARCAAPFLRPACACALRPGPRASKSAAAAAASPIPRPRRRARPCPAALPPAPAPPFQVGPRPHRWQWISLFEVAAGFVLLGLAAGLSLVWQYWGILTGSEPYDEGRPLLQDAQQRVSAVGLSARPGLAGAGPHSCRAPVLQRRPAAPCRPHQRLGGPPARCCCCFKGRGLIEKHPPTNRARRRSSASKSRCRTCC